MEKRICKTCKKEKFLIEGFYITKTIKGVVYRNLECRKCYTSKKRIKYELLKEWLYKYKSKLGCKCCGDKRHYVLDFHHKDPKKKDFNIAYMVRCMYSRKHIIKEAKKCDILCANCHRELHWYIYHVEDEGA